MEGRLLIRGSTRGQAYGGYDDEGKASLGPEIRGKREGIRRGGVLKGRRSGKQEKNQERVCTVKIQKSPFLIMKHFVARDRKGILG